ncbi:MAG: glycoside hydrolase family 3 C-terminal domain-containing protein [Dysgonamonadaceae bacterium]|jgi:beta-glucosidase|nr:glycoside hydrolase family 3 C-terminal domain-containing protein [Dysgonamonadaceae bacterium]
MKKNFLGLLLFLLCISFVSCKKTVYEYPFQNPDLSIEQRAADLVSRLTLDEKVSQMLNKTPAIERLGIPPYDWWNECLHGIGRTEYKVTVFPQAIGMAAGWDVDAIRLMGDYTAEEGRAIYNTAQAKGDYRIYRGLTYWTPNINIFRDPRWGRGQETYGEDPFLTASLAKNFVNGLQGDDPIYLKAAGCAKHFAVHSGPEWNRHVFNVQVSNYDLWDTYLPAFKTLADAKVAGFMCAYQAFDGQPCCGSDKLMIDVLRSDWGFTGYVTSDCGAIDDFYRNHKTHANAQDAAADAVYHGTDLDCGREAYLALKQAVEEGLITEARMDVSLQRLFQIRFRLGMFDPKEKAPFSTIDSTALESPDHKALALKMTRQSMVLLKNDGTLPVDKASLKKVAVVGPNANNPQVQLGNYNGFPTRIITLLDGVRDELGEDVEIYTDSVVDYYGPTPKSFAAAIRKVKDADLIIYAGGISPRIEGEEMRVEAPGFYRGDRTSILLPQIQTDFMKALKATGKPVVFVMMTGSAIAVPWESENVNAILNAWYGGEFAGKAIADILFGRYNPSGRLPVTFYANDNDLPDFEDYDMSGRTYRYFKGKALYPFGYGLSYTNFNYAWVNKPEGCYTEGNTVDCSIKINNIGELSGDEVAQIYIKYPQSGTGLPLKELRSFVRKTILAGQSEEIKVSIPVAELAKWSDEAGKQEIPKGIYTLFAGGNSEDEAISAVFEVK